MSGAGGNAAIPNPFVRVTFYVALDENDDGTPDVDSGGNRLWTSLGNGSVSVTDNGTTRTYTFTMSATGAQLGTASGRTTAGAVTIRAVGYAIDGGALTVADGALVVVTLAVD